MISEEVKNIAYRIGQFFLEKNKLDYDAACDEIKKLRINNLSIFKEITNGKTTIEIETSCPGLVIGRRGEQIDKLSKYLGMEIRLVETRETLLDYLLPYNWQAEIY